MVKKLKNLFFVVLSVAALFAVFTVVASAESYKYNRKNFEVQTAGDYNYIVVADSDLSEDESGYGGGAMIIKYNGTSVNVAVPSSLDGKSVVQIAESAFKGNSSLQTLTVAESVKYIAKEAFADCVGLQTVLVTKNVESVGEGAFSGCSALKSVTFQKDSKFVNIGKYAFFNCTSLNNFSIPEKTESIGAGAFFDCDSLTSINIPDSVNVIGAAAFFGCDSLIEAIIGNGVKALDVNNVAISNSNWGTDTNVHGVFEGCISLQNITIGSSVEIIGQDCFAGTALVNVVIPDNVVTVSHGAFQSCESLLKVVIGDGVTSLGEACFKNCDSLTDVSIGKSVQSFGDISFWDCDALVSITIPTNVTSLGAASFFHCDNLEKVVIGNGVTDLLTSVKDYNKYSDWGNYKKHQYCHGLFEGCVKLKEVVLGSGLKTIGQDCFAGTALETVVIPDNVITVSTGAFANCSALNSVIIGNGVSTLSDFAFYNCTSIAEVHIGYGVVNIGSCAFWNCSLLKEIYIPSNVTTLGNAVFFKCSSLEKAVVGNGVTNLASLADTSYRTFENWGSKDNIHGTFEGCTALGEITLGNGIVSIDRDTFAGTQITTLTVPSKVSTLSTGAFANAKQLRDIYFTGNWPASVGKNIFSNVDEDCTVHYISGKTGYDELEYNKKMFVPVTVTFDNNNDDIFAVPTDSQILAPIGEYVVKPINPTAVGYLFAGWYKDSDCKDAWDFANDKVTVNTTIYAKWYSVDDVVPLRPENITTIEKDGSSVTIRWSAVDGATGYNVYVDGRKHNTSAIRETEYKVGKLSGSTTYEFVVRAVNGKGESPDSIIYAERTTNHIHEYGEWKVVKEATVDAQGSMERTCKTCGKAETRVTEKITAKKGDLNSDCKITAADARIALRISANLQVPTDMQKNIADINGDKKITAADARKILRNAAGLEQL